MELVVQLNMDSSPVYSYSLCSIIISLKLWTRLLIIICDSNLVFRPKLVAESFGAYPLKPKSGEIIRQTSEISYNDFRSISYAQLDDDASQLMQTDGIVELLQQYNIIFEIHNGEI